MKKKDLEDLVEKENNKKNKNPHYYFEKFVFSNLHLLKEKPEKTLTLLNEISKKTKKNMDCLAEYFVTELSKRNEYDENLLNSLNSVYNESTWTTISSRFTKYLSIKFIEKHADKLNWFYISAIQELSEPFIEKFADKVNWKYIFEFQKLSKEFKKKHAWRIKSSQCFGTNF